MKKSNKKLDHNTLNHYIERALKKSNSSKKELGFFSALKIKRFVVFIKHLCD